MICVWLHAVVVSLLTRVMRTLNTRGGFAQCHVQHKHRRSDNFLIQHSHSLLRVSH